MENAEKELKEINQIDPRLHRPNEYFVSNLQLDHNHLIGLKLRISALSHNETTISSKPHTANAGQQFEKYSCNLPFQPHSTP